MTSDGARISTRRERKPRNGKRLSLWPLTLEEAVQAVVQVPPPSKKANVPPPSTPKRNGQTDASKARPPED